MVALTYFATTGKNTHISQLCDDLLREALKEWCWQQLETPEWKQKGWKGAVHDSMSADLLPLLSKIRLVINSSKTASLEKLLVRMTKKLKVMLQHGETEKFLSDNLVERKKLTNDDAFSKGKSLNRSRRVTSTVFAGDKKSALPNRNVNGELLFDWIFDSDVESQQTESQRVTQKLGRVTKSATKTKDVLEKQSKNTGNLDLLKSKNQKLEKQVQTLRKDLKAAKARSEYKEKSEIVISEKDEAKTKAIQMELLRRMKIECNVSYRKLALLMSYATAHAQLKNGSLTTADLREISENIGHRTTLTTHMSVLAKTDEIGLSRDIQNSIAKYGVTHISTDDSNRHNKELRTLTLCIFSKKLKSPYQYTLSVKTLHDQSAKGQAALDFETLQEYAATKAAVIFATTDAATAAVASVHELGKILHSEEKSPEMISNTCVDHAINLALVNALYAALGKKGVDETNVIQLGFQIGYICDRYHYLYKSWFPKLATKFGTHCLTTKPARFISTRWLYVVVNCVYIHLNQEFLEKFARGVISNEEKTDSVQFKIWADILRYFKLDEAMAQVALIAELGIKFVLRQHMWANSRDNNRNFISGFLTADVPKMFLFEMRQLESLTRAILKHIEIIGISSSSADSSDDKTEQEQDIDWNSMEQLFIDEHIHEIVETKLLQSESDPANIIPGLDLICDETYSLEKEFPVTCAGINKLPRRSVTMRFLKTMLRFTRVYRNTFFKHVGRYLKLPTLFGVLTDPEMGPAMSRFLLKKLKIPIDSQNEVESELPRDFVQLIEHFNAGRNWGDIYSIAGLEKHQSELKKLATSTSLTYAEFEQHFPSLDDWAKHVIHPIPHVTQKVEQTFNILDLYTNQNMNEQTRSDIISYRQNVLGFEERQKTLEQSKITPPASSGKSSSSKETPHVISVGYANIEKSWNACGATLYATEYSEEQHEQRKKLMKLLESKIGRQGKKSTESKEHNLEKMMCAFKHASSVQRTDFDKANTYVRIHTQRRSTRSSNVLEKRVHAESAETLRVSEHLDKITAKVSDRKKSKRIEKIAKIDAEKTTLTIKTKRKRRKKSDQNPKKSKRQK